MCSQSLKTVIYLSITEKKLQFLMKQFLVSLYSNSLLMGIHVSTQSLSLKISSSILQPTNIPPTCILSAHENPTTNILTLPPFKKDLSSSNQNISMTNSRRTFIKPNLIVIYTIFIDLNCYPYTLLIFYFVFILFHQISIIIYFLFLNFFTQPKFLQYIFNAIIQINLIKLTQKINFNELFL